MACGLAWWVFAEDHRPRSTPHNAIFWQAASLAAKPGVVAVIDELEKLSKLLGEAVDEEVAAACAKAREAALAEGEQPQGHKYLLRKAANPLGAGGPTRHDKHSPMPPLGGQQLVFCRASA